MQEIAEDVAGEPELLQLVRDTVDDLLELFMSVERGVSPAHGESSFVSPARLTRRYSMACCRHSSGTFSSDSRYCLPYFMPGLGSYSDSSGVWRGVCE